MDNSSPMDDDEVQPVCADSDSPEDLETAYSFRELWRKATDDNYLTLYGFRRFRTSHLLNLRFLEDEIDKLDHRVFQAGADLGYAPTAADKLGLRHMKKDAQSIKVAGVMTRNNVLRLRTLLKQYDESLVAFNKLMLMETFALADSTWHSRLRSDFNAYETYKTRLVRIDQVPRNGSRDLLRHALRKCLRSCWFFSRTRRTKEGEPEPDLSASELESNMKHSYQHTARLAEILTRFLIAVLAGTFLVVPLIILYHQSSNEAHLVTVSVCIIIFSLLISLLSKASNEQIMAATAGYAAVLVVFLSNSSNGLA